QRYTEVDIETLYWEMKEQAQTLTDQPKALAQLQGKYLSQIAALNADLQKSYQTYTATYTEGIKTAQTLNEAIKPTAIYEENLKIVNQLYLNHLQQVLQGKHSVFSEKENDQLLSVAYQCPDSGGDGVYTARLLLALHDPILFFDDVQLCSEEAIYTRQAQTQTDFRIYPNPSDEVLTIMRNTISEESEPFYEVMDMYGKVVAKGKLSLYSTTIDIKSLYNGIYVCKIIKDNVTVQASKITILHQ
ncbi:MAG: Secretion system C-terminal sorting domain, partial [Bacteroidota bacterium]